jgi:hypothetical protein
MMSRQKGGELVDVAVGFAADRSGVGVAYAALQRNGREHVLRVSFGVRPAAALEGREVGYAALKAVAETVRTHYAGPVRFVVADDSLVADLCERRPLPSALTMPYVALRCAMNRFENAGVMRGRSSQIDDLTARANAEASLHIAA